MGRQGHCPLLIRSWHSNDSCNCQLPSPGYHEKENRREGQHKRKHQTGHKIKNNKTAEPIRAPGAVSGLPAQSPGSPAIPAQSLRAPRQSRRSLRAPPASPGFPAQSPITVVSATALPETQPTLADFRRSLPLHRPVVVRVRWQFAFSSPRSRSIVDRSTFCFFFSFYQGFLSLILLDKKAMLSCSLNCMVTLVSGHRLTAGAKSAVWLAIVLLPLRPRTYVRAELRIHRHRRKPAEGREETSLMIILREPLS